MQSYSSGPRGTVVYHLINFLLSKSCPIHLLQKISGIKENMIFSLIFVLQEIWYFRQLRKIKKIWYLRWAFLRKCCFSCSVKIKKTSFFGLSRVIHECIVGENWKYWLIKLYISTIFTVNVYRNHHSVKKWGWQWTLLSFLYYCLTTV